MQKSVKPIAGVYCIELLRPEGRAYIGSSSNVIKRVQGHKALLKAGDHPNAGMQSDWKLHGEDAFDARVVAIIADDVQRLAFEASLITSQPEDRLYNVANNRRSCLYRKADGALYRNNKKDCKTSVYLPADLMAFVIKMARKRPDKSRSKVIQQAVQLLREKQNENH